MSYNKAFFKLYDNYLKSSKVRKEHNLVFTMLSGIQDLYSVVDLGCGSGEYYDYFLKNRFNTKYLGLDLLKNSFFDGYSTEKRWSKFNYREPGLNEFLKDKTGFVSLFSTEITAPCEDNYKLYSRIFNENDQIRAGLVSGFYYTDKTDRLIVEEQDGIISYQCLESLEESQELLPDNIKEMRIVLSVPSDLFGENVIEVWKLFRRV